MAFKRRKNNKARKILRRIRKRKVPKKIKNEIRRTINRTVESKYASIDDSGSSTTPNTSWQVGINTINTIYPTIAQGLERHMRIGNQILIKKMRVVIKYYLSAASLGDWNVRIMLWKPKLMSDITTAVNDIQTSIGGTTPQNIQKPMWNSEDFVLIKDTGVITHGAPNITGRNVFQVVWYVPPHRLLYGTNASTQPTDRQYKVTIAYSSASTVTAIAWEIRSDVMYKDP